jgi:hypothetical protein
MACGIPLVAAAKRASAAGAGFALAGLVLGAAASAHMLPFPAHVLTGGTTVIELAGPNERNEPMTGLKVTVPTGLRVVAAQPNGEWTATVEGATATWSGDTLAPGKEASFVLEVEASRPPGSVRLGVDQLYANGKVARWPVALTVLPAAEESPANLRGALVVLVVGLLLAVALVVLIRRRYVRSLQER